MLNRILFETHPHILDECSFNLVLYRMDGIHLCVCVILCSSSSPQSWSPPITLPLLLPSSTALMSVNNIGVLYYYSTLQKLVSSGIRSGIQAAVSTSFAYTCTCILFNSSTILLSKKNEQTSYTGPKYIYLYMYMYLIHVSACVGNYYKWFLAEKLSLV